MRGTSKQPYLGFGFIETWSMQTSPFWAINEANCIETSSSERGLFSQKRSGVAKAVVSTVHLWQLGPVAVSSLRWVTVWEGDLSLKQHVRSSEESLYQRVTEVQC